MSGYHEMTRTLRRVIDDSPDHFPFNSVLAAPMLSYRS
jgi:hypothetical protein